MQVTTFLMFTGQAEEAMDLYVGLFPRSAIVSLQRYGPGEDGREGTVKRGLIEIAGTRLMCFDSPPVHDFTFTPSMSLFVDCDTRAQLDLAFATLSAGGQVLMPPAAYGFSTWFAWVQDKFGVSWQLNLP
jgi:predicted 3-demethylubiquinone-9 3-methyltransferase (glyoxalase superfamily)